MKPSNEIQDAVIGGGCFWCLDAAFREISGITDVVCGYAGGTDQNPTYERVCMGSTGHAEVVKVSFDTEVIEYVDILDILWAIHNPTTKNQQGYDIGTEYRSIILYQNETQRTTAVESIEKISKLWPDPVVTELVPLKVFYPAEDYHQQYFAKNPTQGYCTAIINPKLVKVREAFRSRLKTP